MPIITNSTPCESFPVALTTRIDASGSLKISYSGETLQENSQWQIDLHVKHDLPTSSTTVNVPMSLTAPNDWTITAIHYNGPNDIDTWSGSSTSECCWTWGETDGEKQLVVTINPPSGSSEQPKTKTVYLKVGPASELPDPLTAQQPVMQH